MTLYWCTWDCHAAQVSDHPNDAEEVPPIRFENGRTLQQDETNEIGPYVYSKLSALPPDPQLTVLEDEAKQVLEERYGRWKFWDGDEKTRPSQEDYAAKYPYRDMPGDEMEEEMWQADAVFVNHILNDAEKLTTRAIEAIFSDYGRGKPLPPEAFSQRLAMFKMEHVDLQTQTTPPPDYMPRSGQRLRGGWTTSTSADLLIRRVLHAMHTNDEFVVVLGGDAAAAGHGNHFAQSYLMEFHRIVAPALARMGVKLVTRNLSMGHGLGTVQSSLGFASLYGKGIDVLIWDCGMTEGTDPKYADLFFRQGLLSGGKNGKIPHLMIGGNSNGAGLFELLRWFHTQADVPVAQLGTAQYSVPVTESEEQAQTLPKVFRYVNCTDTAHELCTQNKHCTQCWVDRPDIPDAKVLFPQMETSATTTPTDTTTTTTTVAEGAQRWWYPGWRQHSLLGRNLAFAILDAMQDGVEMWSSGTMGGPPLDDDEWHIGSYYDNIRAKLDVLLPSQEGDDAKRCGEFMTSVGLPSRICHVSMQGATQHTPRPNATSLTHLLATQDTTLIPTNPKTVAYPGPDVHNQCLDIHNVDVVQVVSMRHRRHLKGSSSWEAEIPPQNEEDLYQLMPPRFQSIHEARRANEERERMASSSSEQPHSRQLAATPLGKGWAIHAEKPGSCNGEYLSICGRESTDSCPLLGYHDSRGEIIGNEACDWLVLDLPNVKEGMVIAKIAFYNTPETLSGRRRGLRNEGLDEAPQEEEPRRLNAALPTNADFAFEFSIDGGAITSWNKDQLAANLKMVHKRVETVTLLDDASFVTAEAKTVQVAMRVKGCSGSCMFALSHIYWA